MTPEKRHADIVKRFPGGLTPEQFRMLTLESADEYGKLDPPAMADWFASQSLLIGMFMNGMIENRCRRDEAANWYITEAGRKALLAYNAE